jgi:hypothetical protein
MAIRGLYGKILMIRILFLAHMTKKALDLDFQEP